MPIIRLSREVQLEMLKRLFVIMLALRQALQNAIPDKY